MVVVEEAERPARGDLRPLIPRPPATTVHRDRAKPRRQSSANPRSISARSMATYAILVPVSFDVTPSVMSIHSIPSPPRPQRRATTRLRSPKRTNLWTSPRGPTSSGMSSTPAVKIVLHIAPSPHCRPSWVRSAAAVSRAMVKIIPSIRPPAATACGCSRRQTRTRCDGSTRSRRRSRSMPRPGSGFVGHRRP